MPAYFFLNGQKYNIKDLHKISAIQLPEEEKEAIDFMRSWKDGQDKFIIKSSGTTGPPKDILLTREQMIASANSTLEVLKIPEGKSALIALPVSMVAGKMMLVRCFVGNLVPYIVTPSGNPLKNLTINIFFAAFSAYQVEVMLREDQEKLKQIHNIIIGGSPVNNRTESLLSSFKNFIYHSFGMSETASHFALRQISPDFNQSYRLLPSVVAGLDERGCLTIQGSITNHKKVITNDLVEFVNNEEFKWLGRYDHIINSGGIKIHPEQLEKKISNLFISNNLDIKFILAGKKDETFNQKLVMIVEKIGEKELSHVKVLLDRELNKFEKPKEYHVIATFPKTESGKVKRKEALRALFDQ